MNANYLLLSLGNFFEGLKVQSDTIVHAVVEFILSLKLAVDKTTESLNSPFEFSQLQITLLKVVLTILLVNLLLIGFYWKKYGTIITDKFIRPSTLKEIEELKLSVAKLKLPKEHSPRI